MGKSSFPEGDMDPARALERISRTTNDIFFGNVRQLNINLTIFFRNIVTKYHSKIIKQKEG